MPDTAQIELPIVPPPAVPPVVAPVVPPPAPPPANDVAPPAQPRPFQEPPHAAFMNRVRREAAVEVKRQLGCTLEEAKAMIAKVKEKPAGDGQSSAQNTADEAVKEAARLRTENETLKREKDKLQTKHDKDIRRLKDKQFEAQLAVEVSRAGITDPDAAELALTMYSRAVRDAKAASKEIPEPAKFFAGLRETKPTLFSGSTPPPAPPPTVIPPTTAPPESTAPGGTPPAPNVPGTPPAAKTADDMSPEEFNQHLRRSGWTPGT